MPVWAIDLDGLENLIYQLIPDEEGNPIVNVTTDSEIVINSLEQGVNYLKIGKGYFTYDRVAELIFNNGRINNKLYDKIKGNENISPEGRSYIRGRVADLAYKKSKEEWATIPCCA